MITVLVTGGRDFTFQHEVDRTLHDIHVETPIGKLIHGGARGADSCAGRWAEANNIPVVIVEAEWDLYRDIAQNGRKNPAGAIRNEKMVAMKPDLVVVFPGNRGTQHCTHLAKKAGIKIHHFDDGQQSLL